MKMHNVFSTLRVSLSCRKQFVEQIRCLVFATAKLHCESDIHNTVDDVRNLCHQFVNTSDWTFATCPLQLFINSTFVTRRTRPLTFTSCTNASHTVTTWSWFGGVVGECICVHEGTKIWCNLVSISAGSQLDVNVIVPDGCVCVADGSLSDSAELVWHARQ